MQKRKTPYVQYVPSQHKFLSSIRSRLSIEDYGRHAELLPIVAGLHMITSWPHFAKTVLLRKKDMTQLYTKVTITPGRKVTTDLLQAVILWSTRVSIAINGDLHGGSLTHDTVCHDAVYKVPTTETKDGIRTIVRRKQTDICRSSPQPNRITTCLR